MLSILSCVAVELLTLSWLGQGQRAQFQGLLQLNGSAAALGRGCVLSNSSGSDCCHPRQCWDAIPCVGGIASLGFYSWILFWLMTLGSNSRLFSVHFCSCKIETRAVNLFSVTQDLCLEGFPSAGYILINQGTSN